MASAFLDITGLSHFLDKLRLLIVQSDWAQADTEEMDFIKNKPTISVDEQTLILNGWLDPAVPITVTQSASYAQTISVSSTASDFGFDASTDTGWVGKGETISISVVSDEHWLAGKAIVNGVVQGSSSETVTVTVDALEISAEAPAEKLTVSCGTYNGGVGFYAGGYGNIQPGSFSLPQQNIAIGFSQITAQVVNGQYTLAVRAVNGNAEVTSFTLLNAQGEDILNTPTLREAVARDMKDNYYPDRQVVFYVKEMP